MDKKGRLTFLQDGLFNHRKKESRNPETSRPGGDGWTNSTGGEGYRSGVKDRKD